MKKISLLVSKVYHLNYYQYVPIRKNIRAKLTKVLLNMCNEYKHRGVFCVTQIEANGAFKSLKYELQAKPFQITLVTCDAEKHVPRAEWDITELKDRI